MKLIKSARDSVGGPSSGKANASMSGDNNQNGLDNKMDDDEDEFQMIETESDQDETMKDGEVDKIMIDSKKDESLKQINTVATVIASILNSITQLR